MRFLLTTALLLAAGTAFCPPLAWSVQGYRCEEYSFVPEGAFEECVHALFVYGNDLCIEYGLRTSVMISQAILEQGTDCYLEPGHRMFNLLVWKRGQECREVFDRYAAEWRCYQVFGHPRQAIKAYLELLRHHTWYYGSVFGTSDPVEQARRIGEGPYAEAGQYGEALLRVQKKVRPVLIEIIRSKTTFSHYKPTIDYARP